MHFIHGMVVLHWRVFRYDAVRPDMPAFTRRARHRQKEDAPRIETAAWVQATSRRTEASVSRV